MGYVKAALDAEDRREAGPNAPPQGLYLVGVRYDQRPSFAGEERAHVPRA
jgi:tRNA U38,U39,U40 pseudouridine synthase TruA